MRTFLFFAMLAALIVGGLYIKNDGYFFQKDETFDIEEFVNLRAKRKGDILPNDVWINFLPGKWKFIKKEIYKDQHVNWTYEGEIEFLKDKTFNLSITCKRKDFTYQEEGGKTNVIGGGSVKGQWAIIKENILMDSTTCDMQVSVGSDDFPDSVLCQEFHFILIGEDNWSSWQSEIREFTKERIFVSGKYFSSDCDFYYLLYKAQSD